MLIHSEMKNKLLDTLLYFHMFCVRYGLRYSLIGGTLLGAVRHGGFIPWDDDVDIIMPRSDYENLISLHEKIKFPYSIKHYSFDSKVHYSFIKLFNETIKLKEADYLNYSPGAWLDIFPLDNVYSDNKERVKHYKRIGVYRKLLTYKNARFVNNSLKNRIKNLISVFVKIIPYSFIKRKLYNYELLVVEQKYLGNLHGSWGVKECLAEKHFDELCLLPFEGYQFFAFGHYDKWLTKVYGDYMVLPEEKERLSRHGVRSE